MKKNKRIYPTEEDPRYGSTFMVCGIQLEDIDNNLTEMIPVSIDKAYPIGKTWEEYRKMKRGLSDAICDSLNKLGGLYKSVVSFKIKYFGDPNPQVI